MIAPGSGRVALLLASLSLAGCLSAPEHATGRTPVRWIVVEKRMGEVVQDGRRGDGRVDPNSVVLTMQPLYREDLSWKVVVEPHDYFVEILEVTPRAQAQPGETVSAKVRVARARPEELYRLIARSSQAAVQILGDSECVVRGDAPAFFRFTSLEPGRAGIAIGVEKHWGREE